MKKKWFIFVEGKSEGPYSFEDLKKDWRITPDTLIWTVGFKNWIAIRHVFELKDLFKENSDSKPLDELYPTKAKHPPLPEEEALALSNDPFPFFWWFILFSCILIYLYYSYMLR